MKKMFEFLKNDEELQQFRKEWKEKFIEPFPLWNYDCFGGPDDYKQRIKKALEMGNLGIICETCLSQACKRFECVIKKSSN